MLSRVRPIPKSQIYHIKKSKEPDHLFKLLQKTKTKQSTIAAEPDEETKIKIKHQIMQKRVDAIIKNHSVTSKVSDPAPFARKQWISPLKQLQENEQFDPFLDKKITKVTTKQMNQAQIQQVVKVLDMNKRLKYFGQYLQVEYQALVKNHPEKKMEKDTKLKFLTKKFEELSKNLRTKLCIMNFPAQSKATFINYLENDKYFQDIIRKYDEELVMLLIDSLKISERFTINSLVAFYDIFVWQIADKKQQMEFVAKLLMQDHKEKLILHIGQTIDLICSKINIDNFKKSLDNFNEVMKKLIFGDDYENAARREYYVTRKALMESLQANEECMSIFINIFYTN